MPHGFQPEALIRTRIDEDPSMTEAVCDENAERWHQAMKKKMNIYDRRCKAGLGLPDLETRK